MQLIPTIHAADYHFVSINNLTEQKLGKAVISEVYRRIGMNIEVTSYSGKRAEFEANEGRKDGEIMRVWSYGNNNPNLIRVPTPYLTLITTAFIKKNNTIKLNKRTDLANYRLARVMGLKHTEDITRGMKNVVEANSTLNMFKLLEQDIVDIALTDYVDGMHTLNQLNSNHQLTPHPKVLAHLPLYHYIHKKHHHLVDKVDAKIKEMITSGELDKIINENRQLLFY